MRQSVDGKWKIVVAASFTAEAMDEVAGFWRDVLGEPVSFEFAPFGQVFQELLNPQSVLRGNRDGANAILFRWSDIAGGQDFESAALELARAVAGAPHAVPLLLASCPEPATGDARAKADVVLRLELSETRSVTVLDAADAFAHYGVTDVHDARADRVGQVPYTEEAFAALATTLVRWRCAAARTPVKMIAVDCDNTLWTGVIGEDGVDAVRLDPGRLALHEALVRQSSAGRIIALASKNEARDVDAFFERRRDSVLKREHILAEAVNWRPKPQNIAAIADQFAVGDDAIVFIDDNPVECAEMRAARPGVLTLEAPQDTAALAQWSDHLWLFDMPPASDEDRRRRDMYRETAARETSRSEAPSFAEFHASLGLKIDIELANEADFPRLAQLTQRTNQFNASLARMSAAELAAAAQGGAVYSVRVRDRFGDYGLVGAMLARAADDALNVDLFLLSCRALGRGVEHAMVARLGEHAAELQESEVRVVFNEGPRNLPAREFLDAVFGAKGPYVGAAALIAATRFDPADGEKRNPAADNGEAGPRHSPVSVDSGVVYGRIARELTTARAIVAAMSARRRPRPDISENYVAPAAGLERAIAVIWENLLGVAPVGAHDPFQALGGKSIHLVRIHGALCEKLGRDIELVTLFEHGTVARLARAIGAGPATDNPFGAEARAAKMRAVRAARREARP